MYKNFAYIGIGSNKGDRLEYFRKAITEIQEDPKCELVTMSSIYETLPYGNKNQGNFYNAAIKIETDYELFDLLDFLKKTEKKIGREKTTRWGPREIDLDLLFYNNVIYSDNRITVPHREITKRDFVLVPLCEIAPGFIHPELKQKISDICIDESENNIINRLQEKIL